jgi:hypothetical protein
MHTKFWLKNLKEGDHIEDLGIDGRVILKWILAKLGGGKKGVDWMHLTQDRDQRQVLVNMVMKLKVP